MEEATLLHLQAGVMFQSCQKIHILNIEESEMKHIREKCGKMLTLRYQSAAQHQATIFKRQ